MILVSGYSVELRARIIDRWQVLEQSIAAYASGEIGEDELMARAMVAAGNKIARLQGRIVQDAPKVTFYDTQRSPCGAACRIRTAVCRTGSQPTRPAFAGFSFRSKGNERSAGV